MKLRDVGMAAVMLAACATGARAGIQQDWFTQFGNEISDEAGEVVVDASGQAWVAGRWGDSQTGGQNMMLAVLSPTGTVLMNDQRTGTPVASASGVALVGSGSVFLGGTEVGMTFDGQTTNEITSAALVQYDREGNWKGTSLFGAGSTGGRISSMAGGATGFAVTGSVGGAVDGQAYAEGHSGAYLSMRDATGGVVWTRLITASTGALGNGTAIDGVGNVYMAGEASGTISGGTATTGNTGFVARYDAAGNQTLFEQFAAGIADSANDVAVDSGGNMYLAGNALGGGFGQGDGFVMKLDSAGNIKWSRTIGGGGEDEINAIAIDRAGRIWVAGSSDSSFGGHQQVGGSQDAYVAEYDSSGSLLGSFWFGTAGNDVVQGLAAGGDGSMYIAGYTTDGPGIFVGKLEDVPEPSSMGIMGMGVATMWLRWRRR